LYIKICFIQFLKFISERIIKGKVLTLSLTEEEQNTMTTGKVNKEREKQAKEDMTISRCCSSLLKINSISIPLQNETAIPKQVFHKI
jgi:hypothetical protein